MSVVHLRTVVTTIFGDMDSEQNVTAREPVVAEVRTFSSEAFEDTYNLIQKQRDENTDNQV